MEISVLEKTRQVLAPFEGRKGVMIPALQAVQNTLGYLPETAIDEIGDMAGVSPNIVFGVASFYSQFRFDKPGDHMVKVCVGTACHVCGAMDIVDSMRRELGAEPGETSRDGKFTLEMVRCFGSCALAPVMLVDNKVYGRMTTARSKEIVGQVRQIEGQL